MAYEFDWIICAKDTWLARLSIAPNGASPQKCDICHQAMRHLAYGVNGGRR
jgi:hypothetical protein